MDERTASISRREALKSTAKIAGVAAFAAPVVVGVFSAQAVSLQLLVAAIARDVACGHGLRYATGHLPRTAHAFGLKYRT